MELLTFLCAYGSLLPLIAVADRVSELIPSRFPDGERDISRYTIRYLSQKSGSSDSESCLKNSSTLTNVSYCSTLRYSLSMDGNLTDETVIHNSYLILLVTPGEHDYSIGNLVLTRSSNIIIAKNPLIQGEVVFKCESFDELHYNNFYIRNVTNVAFLGLTMAYCGPKSTGLTVREGKNIIVENCTLRDNPGGGMIVHDVDDIVILNSEFRDNRVHSLYNETSDLTLRFRNGAGLTIFFADGDSFVQALVQNCTFENNSASLNEKNADDAKQRPRLYIPRGHGGGLLLSFQNTSMHNVTVRNCTFSNNFANFTGGAISVQFYRGASNTEEIVPSSRDNAVVINDVLFLNNSCSENGGALSINSFEAANQNRVTVNGSVFRGNNASQNGGALSSIIEDNIVASQSAKLNTSVIIRCSYFYQNSALIGGSAISLVSNARPDQATVNSWILDCKFIANDAKSKSALLSLRYPIILRGDNIFKGNLGGAITLLQARLDIAGQILFEGNVASNGGGIEMLDYSTLDLQAGVNVTFLSNHATYYGGALRVVDSIQSEDVHVETIRRLYQNCFIQFKSVLPIATYDFSNRTISFINNTAGEEGAAIYTTNLEICNDHSQSQDNNSSSTDYYNNSIFVNEPPFYFSNNMVISNLTTRVMDSIATEPSYFVVVPIAQNEAPQSQEESPQDLQVAPGVELYLHIRVVDQIGNDQPAIWAANFKEGIFSLRAGGRMYEHVFHVEDKAVQSTYKNVCTEPYELGRPLQALIATPQQLDFTLIRSVTGEMANFSRVNVTITCCNPGYTLVVDVCARDESLDDLVSRSDHTGKYLYIKPQFYAEVKNGAIVWASVPEYFQKCTQEGNLSGCLFKYDSPRAQCADNRTGFLCGKCPPGQYIDLTFTACVKCEHWHAVLLTAIVLAFAVMCALVMVFNIGMPSEVRGFLFYIQVVGFVYGGINLKTWDVYLANAFGFSLYVPLCPSPGYDALKTAALGYVLPSTAIVTIIGYIISARFLKRLSNKNSFDGIWLLTFVIYKFTADTCFDILRCEKVDGLQDGAQYVYYYDGSFKCFTTEDTTHLAFAVVAILIGTIVILFPLFILVISFKRFQLTLNITDVLNKDVKSTCRWWGSFDLFRRLIFIVVVAFFGYTWPVYTQLALFFSGLLVFFIFACTRPYTSELANAIEALMLLDLLLVSAIFLNGSNSVLAKVRPLGLVLLLVPFIVTLSFLAFRIVAYIWVKRSPSTLKAMCVGSLCKLMRRTGMKLPPIVQRLECTITNPSASIHISALDDDDTAIDQDRATSYVPFREELLDY